MPRTHNPRDSVIAAAVKARKIAPDRAADYKRLWNADPSGIRHLLTAPVEQGGLMAGVAAPVAPFDPVPDEYPSDWLPELEGKQLNGNVAFEDASAATQGASGAGPRRGDRPAAPSQGRGGRVVMEP